MNPPQLRRAGSVPLPRAESAPCAADHKRGARPVPRDWRV